MSINPAFSWLPWPRAGHVRPLWRSDRGRIVSAKLVGPGLVLCSSAALQVSSAVSVSVFGAVGTAATSGLRFLTAAIVLLAVARPRLRGRSGGTWFAVVAFGAVLAGMNQVFYLAADRVPLGMAVTIEFLGPLVVAVARARRRRELLWAAFAALGVLMLAGPTAAMSVSGLIGPGRIRRVQVIMRCRRGCRAQSRSWRWGLQSKREITRTRIRVRTAMATQTREQGRYLGGCRPYGYRLADAGPHPTKAHAAWGRRAHRLEPNPATGRSFSGCSRKGWPAVSSLPDAASSQNASTRRWSW